jgi:hypothetical protein
MFLGVQVYCWVKMSQKTLNTNAGEFMFALLCIPEDKVSDIWQIEFYTVLVFQFLVSLCMLISLYLIHKYIRTVIRDQSARINYCQIFLHTLVLSLAYCSFEILCY